jgi:hypothetical protein
MVRRGIMTILRETTYAPRIAGGGAICSLKIQTIDEGGYWVARYLADAGDAWILGDWGLGVVRVGGELKLSRSTCLEANSNR